MRLATQEEAIRTFGADFTLHHRQLGGPNLNEASLWYLFHLQLTDVDCREALSRAIIGRQFDFKDPERLAETVRPFVTDESDEVSEIFPISVRRFLRADAGLTLDLGDASQGPAG